MFLHLLHLANIGRIWVLWRLLCHFIHAPDPEYFFDNAVSVCSKGENFLFGNLSFTHVIIRVFGLREDVSINRTNSKYCGKSPKFVFSPTFIFCSPICPNNCGEVFLWKYILVFEKWYFFVRPLKYANFHREYYPNCETSCNEFIQPPAFLWA